MYLNEIMGEEHQSIEAEDDLLDAIVKPVHGLVLVCDDDPDTRAIVEHAVEAMGHRVVTAVDGMAAKESFLEEQPDVVVMDIMMPQVDGDGVYHLDAG